MEFCSTTRDEMTRSEAKLNLISKQIEEEQGAITREPFFSKAKSN